MKRMIIPMIVACVAIGTGLALAQQEPDTDPPDRVSRYNVATAGDSAVLVDSATGRTWLLQRSTYTEQNAVWLPITRLDDEEAVAVWREEEKWRKHQSVMEKRDQLAEIRARLDSLRKKFKAPHPTIRLLERQAEGLEQSLED